MRFLLVWISVVLATQYDNDFCYGNKCSLKERSVATCTLICDEYVEECRCSRENSTALGCYLFDHLLSSSINVCNTRKSEHFLHLGTCSDKTVYCSKYEEREYHWCPYILRFLCNLFRHLWNLFMTKKWELLEYKYYVYRTPYGDYISLKERQNTYKLVDCDRGCYSYPAPQDSDLESLLGDYVPEGSSDDDEVLSDIQQRLEDMKYHQYLSQRDLDHKLKKYHTLVNVQKQKKTPMKKWNRRVVVSSSSDDEF